MTGSSGTRLPLFSVSGDGLASCLGTGSGSLGLIVASGTGQAGTSGASAGVFPPPEADGGDVTLSGQGAAELPALTADADGAGGKTGSGTATLPLMQASGTGLGVGSGAVTLSALDASGDLATGYSLSAALTLPVPTATATGQTGGTGTGEATLPALTAAATGYGNATGTGAGAFGPIAGDGQGEPDRIADLAAGYTAMSVAVLNYANAGVAVWENCPFDRIVKVGSWEYGSCPSGIYRLDGDDDAGTDIEASVRKFGIDLGVPLAKRVTDAYVRLRSTTDYVFTVEADGVSCVRPVSDNLDGAHSKKIDLARGLSGRRIGFTLANTEGGDLSLDKIDLEVELLERRART